MIKLRLFNKLIMTAFFIFAIVFALFFSIDEGSISKDIPGRYDHAEILIQKDIKDTKIVLFSVGEMKTGIANYVEIPFVNRFFCQKIYALDNLEGQPPVIADVFKSKWAGYCITATPEEIKLDVIYVHIKRKPRV